MSPSPSNPSACLLVLKISSWFIPPNIPLPSLFSKNPIPVTKPEFFHSTDFFGAMFEKPEVSQRQRKLINSCASSEPYKYLASLGLKRSLQSPSWAATSIQVRESRKSWSRSLRGARRSCLIVLICSFHGAVSAPPSFSPTFARICFVDTVARSIF